MCLLSAEDERELSRAISAILKHHNYSVDAVYDGESAEDYILTGIYDGVILDIMMPGKDGITVLKNMRSRKEFTPVILLTAKSEIDDRVLGLDSCELKSKNGSIKLANKDFQIMEMLMDKIWGFDSSGDTLAAYTLSKQFTSAVISCPGIEEGGEYTVSCGQSNVSVTMSQLIYGGGM